MNKKLEYLKKVAKPKKLDLNSISDLQQNYVIYQILKCVSNYSLVYTL